MPHAAGPRSSARPAAPLNHLRISPGTVTSREPCRLRVKRPAGVPCLPNPKMSLGLRVLLRQDPRKPCDGLDRDRCRQCVSPLCRVRLREACVKQSGACLTRGGQPRKHATRVRLPVSCTPPLRKKLGQQRGMEPDFVYLKTPASSDRQTPRFHAPQDRERPPGGETTIRAESILNAVNLPCELANIRLTTKRAVGMRQRGRCSLL